MTKLSQEEMETVRTGELPIQTLLEQSRQEIVMQIKKDVLSLALNDLEREKYEKYFKFKWTFFATETKVLADGSSVTKKLGTDEVIKTTPPTRKMIQREFSEEDSSFIDELEEDKKNDLFDKHFGQPRRSKVSTPIIKEKRGIRDISLNDLD